MKTKEKEKKVTQSCVTHLINKDVLFSSGFYDPCGIYCDLFSHTK